MERPLMPKATAVWLIDNTALTFDQIAAFSGLHILEVQGIADGEVNPGMQGLNPITAGELTKSEIARCENDATAKLQMPKKDMPLPAQRSKGPRYTPISKRGDKPDAIAWLLRNHPELSDAQVGKLIGTTKPTVQAVRDRSHWNAANIRAQHPVALGLCLQKELDEAVDKARRNRGNIPDESALPPVPDYPDGTLSGSFEAEESSEAVDSEPTAESIFGSGSLPDHNSSQREDVMTEELAREAAEKMFSSLGEDESSQSKDEEPDLPSDPNALFAPKLDAAEEETETSSDDDEKKTEANESPNPDAAE